MGDFLGKKLGFGFVFFEESIVNLMSTAAWFYTYKFEWLTAASIQ